MLQFASTSKVEPRSWKRATSVEVMPIKLCKSARENIEKIFAASGKIVDLQKAIAADEAVVAALEGAKREVADVFAVFLSEGKLTVYVY